jgi:photosystem II stability/assembly factor-like uncharacterized protein
MRFQRLFTLLLLLLAGLPAAAVDVPTWTPLGPFGGFVYSITPDPVTAGVLYASTTVGVYRTADAGASWSLIHAISLFSGRVAVDPLHPSTLYLTGALGSVVLKSVDGGAHWSPSDEGLPRYNAVLAVDPVRPRRLYLGSLGLWRSLDAGSSWQPAGIDTLPGGDQVLIESIAASRPAGRVFVGTQSGVYRSNDGGDTWSVVNGLPRTFARAVAFAPSDPRIVYAGLTKSGLPGAGGLYRSTDGGVSWRRVLQTKPPYAAQEISISPSSPRIVYARFEDRSLYRSTDGGDHWTQLQAAGQVDAVAADRFSAATVWSGLTGFNTGGVWRSGNQGKTWTARSTGITGIATTSLAIDPQDPERLWTTTSLGPLRTPNGGAGWTGARIPRGETDILRFAAGSGSRIVALTYKLLPGEQAPPTTHRLWQTDDDGASWKRLAAPSDQILAFQIASSTLYAVEALPSSDPSLVQRVLRSTDGGVHWEKRAQTALSCGLGDLAVAPSQTTIVYLGGCKAGHATVLRSGDGGATFSELPAAGGLPGSSLQTLAVDPRSPNTVWAGTGILFLEEATGDGVWKSIEGGAWTRAGSELAGLTITALLAPDIPGRVWAASRDGRVFRSDDGGASWEDWSAGLLAATVYSLQAAPDDPHRIYAVTSRGIWTLTQAD